MHYSVLHLFFNLTCRSQPCWNQTFLTATFKILQRYRGNILERRWHVDILSVPDSRTDGRTDSQTYVTRSQVHIVNSGVYFRPSQHNFGIPKQISEVWDFILYFYVFRWLVNRPHTSITYGIPKRLVLNSSEKSRRGWNIRVMEYSFMRMTGVIRLMF